MLLKYGCEWPDDTDPLIIEFTAIKKGGRWLEGGSWHGEGIFHHYREAQMYLWPTGEDHHRWSDLMLSTILGERITVCAGSRDSGKTHVALSRYALTDYWCFPDDTLILISSTDMRGLKLRILGDMNSLYARAKEMRPWLAGNPLQNPPGIFTDKLDEDSNIRDIRKGIIGIPCLGNSGQWVGGLEKYVGIKQRRRRLLGDEMQFMHEEYLTVLSNLDKPSLDFKGVFVGNHLGQKALDRVAEPVEGWDAHPISNKTETFRNKYGGITINLIGTDSPNYDFPDNEPSRFPYLIDRADEEVVAKRYGRNSLQYCSQILGVRKAGLNAHRVLTREMCVRFEAFRKCIWKGDDTTKVFGLDAAYGGDRAVGGHIEFGPEHSGQIVIKVFPPEVIPVSTTVPEEELATWSKRYCDLHEIPGANVFFDAGMRATLATWMSKTISVDVNAVNFGGNPTPRPVSNDDFVFDEKLQEKRLKRCDEAYSKFVTELWFSVRMAVESRQITELPDEVAEEFYMREWTYVKGDKYELETKEETKKRMGCSPDYADWCAIAVEGARRLGFVIERMRDGSEQKEDDKWLEREVAKHQRFLKKHELHYA